MSRSPWSLPQMHKAKSGKVSAKFRLQTHWRGFVFKEDSCSLHLFTQKFSPKNQNHRAKNLSEYQHGKSEQAVETADPSVCCVVRLVKLDVQPQSFLLMSANLQLTVRFFKNAPKNHCATVIFGNGGKRSNHTRSKAWSLRNEWKRAPKFCQMC